MFHGSLYRPLLSLVLLGCGASASSGGAEPRGARSAQPADQAAATDPVVPMAAMNGRHAPDGPIDGLPATASFDVAAVRREMHQAAKRAAKDCASLPPGGGGDVAVLLNDGNGHHGTEMDVALRLRRDGHVEITHVATVTTEPDDRSALGQCVRAAFESARIPPYAASSDAALEWYVDVWSTSPSR